MSKPNSRPLRIALVVPHIFMHRDILPNVIFSPGQLAISLADRLRENGLEVTLFSPGPVSTKARNVTADLSYFEAELAGRGDGYMDLLRKHPFTFVTLARQVQGELIANVYESANHDEFDLVHIYTNEEELGYTFARFCQKPVVFTHHDPYNFLVKYKNYMPKYRHLNWISMSFAQRSGMPRDTNWVGNIYHGLDDPKLTPASQPTRDYLAYLGRIIEPKGVHLAIKAVRSYNQRAATPIVLKIAGKHYADSTKDDYWKRMIMPELDETIQYVGFIDRAEAKRDFLANAKATMVPSLFDEPFGMVTIESFACATPVIAIDSGALSEVVADQKTGIVVPRSDDQDAVVDRLAQAIDSIADINPDDCRLEFEDRFTTQRMARDHQQLYEQMVKQSLDRS